MTHSLSSPIINPVSNPSQIGCWDRCCEKTKQLLKVIFFVNFIRSYVEKSQNAQNVELARREQCSRPRVTYIEKSEQPHVVLDEETIEINSSTLTNYGSVSESTASKVSSWFSRIFESKQPPEDPYVAYKRNQNELLSTQVTKMEVNLNQIRLFLDNNADLKSQFHSCHEQTAMILLPLPIPAQPSSSLTNPVFILNSELRAKKENLINVRTRLKDFLNKNPEFFRAVRDRINLSQNEPKTQYELEFDGDFI